MTSVLSKVKWKSSQLTTDIRNIQKNTALYIPKEKDINKSFILDFSILSLMYFAAIYIGLYIKQNGNLLMLIPLGLSLFIYTIILVRVSFKAHNFEHSNAKNSLLYFKGMDFFVGASSFVWNSQHFSTHHKFPNTLYLDENLDAANRKVLFTERSYDQRDGADQAGKISTLFSFVFTTLYYKQLQALVFARAFIKGIYMSHCEQRERKIRDYVFFIVSRIFLISMFYVVPYFLFGLYGLLAYFIVSALWSSIFFLTFESNHHGMLSKVIYIKTQKDLELDFYKLQLNVTLNVATNNKFFSWLVYDFNFHIAHHVFPSVDVKNYPELSRKLKELLDLKYPDIKYHEIGLNEALTSVLKQYLSKPVSRSYVINDSNYKSNLIN